MLVLMLTKQNGTLTDYHSDHQLVKSVDIQNVAYVFDRIDHRPHYKSAAYVAAAADVDENDWWWLRTASTTTRLQLIGRAEGVQLASNRRHAGDKPSILSGHGTALRIASVWQLARRPSWRPWKMTCHRPRHLHAWDPADSSRRTALRTRRTANLACLVAHKTQGDGIRRSLSMHADRGPGAAPRLHHALAVNDDRLNQRGSNELPIDSEGKDVFRESLRGRCDAIWCDMIRPVETVRRISVVNRQRRTKHSIDKYVYSTGSRLVNSSRTYTRSKI